MRAIVILMFLATSAHADLYAHARPTTASTIQRTRTVRLDVSKKRIVALRARCDSAIEVEVGVNARKYIAYQLAKIDTIEVGTELRVTRSDGRSIVADRDFGAFGFFDPTPHVTFYVSIGPTLATVAMIFRGPELCAERWNIPVEDT